MIRKSIIMHILMLLLILLVGVLEIYKANTLYIYLSLVLLVIAFPFYFLELTWQQYAFLVYTRSSH